MGNVIFKKRQAKGNDAQMKRNKANRTTKKDLRRMIVVSGIVVFGLVGVMFFSPLSSQYTEDGAGMDTCLKSWILWLAQAAPQDQEILRHN